MSIAWTAILFLGIITYLFAQFLIPIAERIQLVDKPNGRKAHSGNIPVVGGIAIYLAVTLSTYIFTTPPEELAAMISLGGLITVIGALDDRFSLPAKLRLSVQLLAGVAVATGANIYLENLGNLLGSGTIILGIFTIPLTAIAISGLSNAYNMCDGIDGLTGFLTLVALGGLSLWVWEDASEIERLIVGFYMISVAVYLPMNLSRKNTKNKIFMGDAGSVLLGFTISSLMIYFSQRYEALRPVDTLWLVALPLMDMASTMIRRLLKRKSPFKADKTHLHHILIRAGLPQSQTLTALVVYAALCAFAGWLLSNQAEIISLTAFITLFSIHLYVVLRAFKITYFVHKTLRHRRKASRT